MRQGLNRSILVLAVPSIISNITTPLLGLVSTAISGHLGNAVYIAAIATVGSMFNLFYWLFSFLRMGTSGMTAIAMGRRDSRSQALILYRGGIVASVTGFVLIVLTPFILPGLLWFLNADAGTSQLASRYFSIVIWGAPAVLGSYVLSGWFLGMQSSWRPMVISILTNVINIVLSPILAFVMDMKLDGLAVGTLVAQWSGFVVGLIMCVSYHLDKVAIREILDRKALGHYFAVNRDIMLRTACLIAVTLWFTREGARQGDITLAVNAVLMQFFVLFSYMIDGFAFAGEALIGKFTGSGDKAMVKKCITTLMKWGAVMAITYSVVYFLAGDSLLRILTNDAGVRAASHDYVVWAVTIPLAGFAAFIWDGVYIGSTATKGMLLSMAIATATFFVVYFILRSHLGNHALWLAFISYLLMRGVAQTLLWRRSSR